MIWHAGTNHITQYLQFNATFFLTKSKMKKKVCKENKNKFLTIIIKYKVDRLIAYADVSRCILLLAVPFPLVLPPLLIFLRLVSERVRALSYILCNDKLINFSAVITTNITIMYTIHIVRVVGKYCNKESSFIIIIIVFSISGTN
jgi:hypothetical protein